MSFQTSSFVRICTVCVVLSLASAYQGELEEFQEEFQDVHPLAETEAAAEAGSKEQSEALLKEAHQFFSREGTETNSLQQGSWDEFDPRHEASQQEKWRSEQQSELEQSKQGRENGKTKGDKRQVIDLGVRPRVQWNRGFGYCASSALQMVALKYGTWMSQSIPRAMVAAHDALNRTGVPKGAGKHTVATGAIMKYIEQKQTDMYGIASSFPKWAKAVLPYLRFRHRMWAGQSHQPQYEKFMVWMKQHLVRKHPVIFGMFVRGGKFLNYDHVVAANGVGSKSLHSSSYTGTDVLYFNDGYDFTFHHNRTFNTLNDTRKMNKNCRNQTRSHPSRPSWHGGDFWKAGKYYHYFCIPNNFGHGMAILGIDDPRKETFPTSIKMNNSSEPHPPGIMSATITVSGLTDGVAYVLLRYDDYTKVPRDKFLERGGYTTTKKFVAHGTTWTYSDPQRFMSNTVRTWRCVRFHHLKKK